MPTADAHHPSACLAGSREPAAAKPDSFGLMRAQLWTWFAGMIVLTFPWHYVGILGMPRRMAFYDFSDPEIARQASSVVASVAGGAILVVSGILFLAVLIRGHVAPRAGPGVYRFSVALHPPQRVPAALNSFGLWLPGSRIRRARRRLTLPAPARHQPSSGAARRCAISLRAAHAMGS